MNRLLASLIVSLLFAPLISLAAPLTQAQAKSLIGVVQASPNTPASAFTGLITAFSNITIAQANSLIVVVQAAPGVPANAFVDLLVSFTEDTQITYQEQTSPPPQESQTQQTPHIQNTTPQSIVSKPAPQYIIEYQSFDTGSNNGGNITYCSLKYRIRSTSTNAPGSKPDFGTALDRTFGFLKSPYVYWQKDDLTSKQLVLKLVFTDRIAYERGVGFGTAKLALPLRVFELSATDNSSYVVFV